MEFNGRRCDECGGVPRRLALEMDGKLFCQRDCYLAYCARNWDQAFEKTFRNRPDSKVLELRRAL